MHVYPEEQGLNFRLSFHLNPYFVYARGLRQDCFDTQAGLNIRCSLKLYVISSKISSAGPKYGNICLLVHVLDTLSRLCEALRSGSKAYTVGKVDRKDDKITHDNR